MRSRCWTIFRLGVHDGGGGGRIPRASKPILHAPRDNISRKGKSLTPIKKYVGKVYTTYKEYIKNIMNIYIYIYVCKYGEL